MAAVLAASLLGLTVRSDDAVAAPAARAVPLELGVTSFLMWRDWDTREKLLDRVRDSGSEWLRVDIGWCSLEEDAPGRITPWYQERLDTVVAGALKRGLKLSINIFCSPSWSGAPAYDDYPRDVGQFRRITTYLATRYKGRVAAWEIWNEPDCIGAVGCPYGSPTKYVAMLRAGYLGINAGDPAALVVTGGTGGANAEWIELMYDAGAKGWFDVLAVHPYLDPADAPPDMPSNDQAYRLTSIPLVRAEMGRNGDAGKPIWLTEFGWTTADTGPRTGVDEQTQAAYLRQAVEQIEQDYPYVTRAFWFSLRERDDWNPYENEFGLLRVNGTPKPSYWALRNANAWLAQQ